MLTESDAKKIKEAAREYALAENVAGHDAGKTKEAGEKVRRLCLAFHALVDELTEKK